MTRMQDIDRQAPASSKCRFPGAGTAGSGSESVCDPFVSMHKTALEGTGISPQNACDLPPSFDRINLPIRHRSSESSSWPGDEFARKPRVPELRHPSARLLFRPSVTTSSVNAAVPLATTTTGNSCTADDDKRREKRNRRAMQGHVRRQKRPHALEGSMKRTYIARCQQVHSVGTSTK